MQRRLVASRCCRALVVLLTRRIPVERIRKGLQPRRGMPMTSVDLEQRVATLEAELAKLKAELGTASGKQDPWWKEIAGIFADDPAFEEAMRLGRQWRESFRPKPPRKKNSDGRSRHGSPDPARKKAVRRKSSPPSPPGSS
jgi:hypothetical protein